MITRLNIGGPSIQAITLSDRLTARGFDTHLVHGALGEGEGDMRYLLPPTTRATVLASLRRPISPAQDLIAVRGLLAMMRTFEPDILHTHMAKAGAVGRAAATLYNAGRTKRVRVVHTYHGHVLEGYFGAATTRLFLGVERLLARASDRLVAISPEIKSELLHEQRIGRDEQYVVIPLGFDLTALAAIDDAQRCAARVTLGLMADAHVISTVGRLTAIKNHALFLEAAARIARQDPSAMFVIAGDGELRADLEARAQALGIADRVRFLGWRRDLAVIYGATDVFLLTSRNEGTPVALIESLAAATPGVSTDVGGVRDVIDSAEVGLLAASGDAQGLADHVLALAADPERRRRMGERGRRSIVARYALDRLVDDVERLYRGVLR
jgi:glycosyltransferase involved in cell wall biosynthesis